MGYDWDKYYNEKSSVWTQPDEVFVKELSAWLPGNAVDMGAGEGADSIWLASKGWRVTAVDSSKVGLKNLLKQAKSKGLKVNATCSDILKFVAIEPYDLVYLGFIHFPEKDRPALYKKCKSLLKSRGKIVIVGLINSDDPSNQTLPFEIFPTQDKFKEEIKEAGLKLEKLEIIHRKIDWSDGEGFEGESMLAVARM